MTPLVACERATKGQITSEIGLKARLRSAPLVLARERSVDFNRLCST